MIINVLDGCYIVFDTKNRNIKLYTLLIKYLVSGHCILVCRHIVIFRAKLHSRNEFIRRIYYQLIINVIHSKR